MSETIEWFDLAELDNMVDELHYFKYYRVKYHYHLSVEIYCEDASRELDFDKFLYDLERIKEFFAFAENKKYTCQDACFQAYLKNEEIKGYAAAHAEA